MTAISFEMPDAELCFGEGDLDIWAEHLEWCFRVLGLGAPRSIAVQDFGTSPLAFLGSSLLMPTLGVGAAERLGARLVCLDASPDRVVLTPEVLRQVDPDVLVVRADVLGLLVDVCRRAGLDLAGRDSLTVVVAVGPEPVPLPPGPWQRLLHAESALLLAPECPHCAAFHLRSNTYRISEGRSIENLLLEGAASCAPRGMEIVDDACPRCPDDALIRLALHGQTGAA